MRIQPGALPRYLEIWILNSISLRQWPASGAGAREPTAARLHGLRHFFLATVIATLEGDSPDFRNCKLVLKP